MKRVVSILIICFCIACGNSLIDKPNNLISKKEMVNIYYDLAIINAANNTNYTVLAEQNLKTMPYIYAKYKIDSVQLAESNEYYAADPPGYENIYEDVKKKIEAERLRIEDSETKRLDSIKNTKESPLEKAKRESRNTRKPKDTLPNTSQKQN